MKSSAGGELDFTSTAAWLKENNLESLISAFEVRQVTLDELVEFAITDLREFATELNLEEALVDRLVECVLKAKKSQSEKLKVKLVGESYDSSLNVTPISSSSTTEGTLTGIKSITTVGTFVIPPLTKQNTLVRVMVTPQEDQAMAKLYEKHAALQRASQTVGKALQVLDDNSNKCIVSIEKAIGESIAELQARKQTLTNGVAMAKLAKKKIIRRTIKKTSWISSSHYSSKR